MVGTFGGALEARQIAASDGKLRASVRGIIETEQGVLIIKSIHVHLRLQAPEEVRTVVARVHDVYAARCPIYQTLHTAIAITSDFELFE